MALQLTITNVGRAAIVNANNTGTAPVTIAQLGLTATNVAANPALTALAGEFKRIAAVAGDVVADDVIHLTALDAGGDAYTVRSIGLYLADGTLFAIYGQAAPIVEKTAATLFLLATDITFQSIDATDITFGATNFINPPATETVKGVAEIATQAESDAGLDDVRIVTPKKMRASVLAWFAGLMTDVWRASNDGAGSGLDADLLDGQHGTYYLNLANATGTLANARFSGSYDGITEMGMARIRLTSTTDASLSSTAHAFQVGPDTGGNIIIDGNEIMARNNGATSTLALNFDGGLVTIGGSTAWHAGNDGAGTGLDADLLDGQHGSYYTNIPARLGFTPLDAADYTAADVRAKLLTVDGSGSSLDADLLDGQHGSYYTNIVARLGYTPLNVTAYTAADVRTKLLTVDGSGSSLDADLLDGQHGSYYNNLGNATGTLDNGRLSGSYSGITSMEMTRLRLTSTSDASLSSTNHAFQVGPDTGANIIIDGNELMARSNGGAGDLLLNYDGGAVVIGAGGLLIAGGTAWHSGNDGAGSGLDADLLDGQQGSYYTNITARLGFTPLNATAYTAADVRTKLLTVDGSGSGIDADLLDGQHASAFVQLAQFTGSNQSIGSGGGYQKLPGGLILQAGTISLSNDSYGQIVFPVTFPTGCWYAAVEGMGQIGNESAANNNPRVYSWGPSLASLYNPQEAMTARWIAIGA